MRESKVMRTAKTRAWESCRPVTPILHILLPLNIGIHNHAVDRLAKNRRKDIKLLDTKLSVSRGAHSHMFD